MQVAMFGPLRVGGRVGDDGVRVSGRRLQALLIRLALAVPHGVSGAELTEAIWPEDAPSDAGNALQALVSRLRRLLGTDAVITSQATGYRWELDPDDLDLHRFRVLVGQGRQAAREARSAAALAAFEAALDLCRGEPLPEVAESWWAQGVITELDDLRLEAAIGRAEAMLALDRAGETVAALQSLAEQHPLHEGVAAQLITALGRTGRTGEALESYERLRRRLVEELGTDPGVGLQRLHLALVRGELDGSARPAGAGARPPTNFGTPLTSFVGRESELDRLAALTGSERVVTVVGPGGAGKTRIAGEAARRWMEDHHRSAWLVELAPLGTPDGIVSSILSATGLSEVRVERTDRPPLAERAELLRVLAGTECLLVVDNCEHLIGAVAQLVAELVGHAPGITVLATSREPLGLTGEALVPLPPLDLPPENCPLEAATDYPSVRLFTDRATALSADFTLDARSWPAVATIVRRLDGLPLAIELAVARLRVLPVDEVAGRLSDRFRLLTGGDRTSLPRHRTLRAVVDWSWELLSEPERLLAGRLALFPAGATEEAAVAICADTELPEDRIAESLIMLAEKSLLHPQPGSPLRYRMLETIREYGIEWMAETHRLDEARLRHAEYFEQLVIAAEPVLRSGEQLQALATVRADEANILAARSYLLDSGRLHQALMMTLAMSWLAVITGSRHEQAWLLRLIEAHRGTEEPYLVFAEALAEFAGLTERADTLSWSELRPRMAQVHERLKETEVSPPFSSLEAMSSMFPIFAGLPDEAAKAQQRALTSPDPWVRAMVHGLAAAQAENEGDTERTRAELLIAEREFRQTGDRWGIAMVTGTRAQLRSVDGDPEGALTDLRQAQRVSDELGASDDARFIRLRAAGVLVQLGRFAEAREEVRLSRALESPSRRAEDEELIMDAMEITIDWVDLGGQAARPRAADVRARALARTERSSLARHSVSIALGSTALISADLAEDEPAELDRALSDLRVAYPAAVASEDMPVIAQLGAALASTARLLDRPEVAAEILGASARLRGGADAGPGLTRLVERLRGVLGETYDERFEAGRNLDRPGAIARMDPDRLSDQA